MEWQPIETMPSGCQEVIVWCDGSECAGIAYKTDSGEIIIPEPQAIGYDSLSHWMPLPTQPKLIESEPLWHVGYWGEVAQSQAFLDEIRNAGKDNWFASQEDAMLFLDRLKDAAFNLDLNLAYTIDLDEKPYHRLIATMDLIVPSGERVEYAYDFGHCYDVEAAEYMFSEGNYACDCNRSRCIGEALPDFKELECGETIEMENFKTAYILDEHLKAIGIHPGII